MLLFRVYAYIYAYIFLARDYCHILLSLIYWKIPKLYARAKSFLLLKCLQQLVNFQDTGLTLN